MLRILLPIAIALMLGACTTTSDNMKWWMGKSDTALLQRWGAPDLETESSNGSKILTYYGERDDYGQPTCRKTFTVNPDGKLTHWHHNCAF